MTSIGVFREDAILFFKPELENASPHLCLLREAEYLKATPSKLVDNIVDLTSVIINGA